MTDFSKKPDVAGHVAPQARMEEVFAELKLLRDGLDGLSDALDLIVTRTNVLLTADATDGQVLTVVDGEAAWADLPAADPGP